MLNVQELCKQNSRKGGCRECLTMRYRAWKCLISIAFACWESQEVIEIARMPGNRNLCLHFLGIFSSFALVHMPLSSLVFGLPSFYMYQGMD